MSIDMKVSHSTLGPTVNNLNFFDCNSFIGRPANGGIARPAASADQLLAEMDRIGINKALVWHIAQDDADPLIGNRLLSDELEGQDRLYQSWSVFPNHCGELGDIDEWFQDACRRNVRAMRMSPEIVRFLPRAGVIDDIVDRMIARRIPLVFSFGGAGEDRWPMLYDMMEDFPELTVIIADTICWGSDRLFRPLLDRYPNMYLETSGYIVSGGIEAFVQRYGARRLLFGSRFPVCYQGAMMLAIAHAPISDDDKAAIASGNMERLVSEVRL